MRLKIDLEIPAWTKWLLGGLAAGIALSVGAYVLAAVTVPNTFADGDTLSAQKMNDNFNTLATAINSLASGRFVATINGKSYSVGATAYVGSTSGIYTGSGVGGYGGAKTKCEAAIGSPSAHMCSAEEVIRSRQAGITIPGGWYSTAASGGVPGGSSDQSNDCRGWSSTTAVNGTAWQFDQYYQTPNCDDCINTHKIMCCD